MDEDESILDDLFSTYEYIEKYLSILYTFQLNELHYECNNIIEKSRNDNMLDTLMKIRDGIYIHYCFEINYLDYYEYFEDNILWYYIYMY